MLKDHSPYRFLKVKVFELQGSPDDLGVTHRKLFELFLYSKIIQIYTI